MCVTYEERQRKNEYQRRWSKDHPDKIREYRLNRMRRAALAEILAGRSGQKLTKEGDQA